MLYIQSEARQGVAAHLGALSPYTLRKYGACGSDLAQHGRDRIDQADLGAVVARGRLMGDLEAAGLQFLVRPDLGAEEPKSAGAAPVAPPALLRCPAPPAEAISTADRRLCARFGFE